MLTFRIEFDPQNSGRKDNTASIVQANNFYTNISKIPDDAQAKHFLNCELVGHDYVPIIIPKMINEYIQPLAQCLQFVDDRVRYRPNVDPYIAHLAVALRRIIRALSDPILTTPESERGAGDGEQSDSQESKKIKYDNAKLKITELWGDVVSAVLDLYDIVDEESSSFKDDVNFAANCEKFSDNAKLFNKKDMTNEEKTNLKNEIVKTLEKNISINRPYISIMLSSILLMHREPVAALLELDYWLSRSMQNDRSKQDPPRDDSNDVPGDTQSSEELMCADWSSKVGVDQKEWVKRERQPIYSARVAIFETQIATKIAGSVLSTKSLLNILERNESIIAGSMPVRRRNLLEDKIGCDETSYVERAYYGAELSQRNNYSYYQVTDGQSNLEDLLVAQRKMNFIDQLNWDCLLWTPGSKELNLADWLDTVARVDVALAQQKYTSGLIDSAAYRNALSSVEEIVLKAISLVQQGQRAAKNQKAAEGRELRPIYEILSDEEAQQDQRLETFNALKVKIQHELKGVR